MIVSSLKFRLETLNEKRSGVVQMVKLAEKERDNLEVCRWFPFFVCDLAFVILVINVFFEQGVKDEAETYMLKELSHLKWQEKATKMAYEDTLAKITEQKESLESLENNLKDER